MSSGSCRRPVSCIEVVPPCADAVDQLGTRARVIAPGLLDPGCMSESVLARLTEDGGFGCLIDPDRPWAAASNQEILEFRRRAGHVAGNGD